LNQRRLVRIPLDHEICERLFRRVELCPDAAACRAQIREREPGHELARFFEEDFQRTTVAFMVVLR